MDERAATRLVGDAERAMNALRRLVRALRVSTVAVQRTSGISGAQLFVLRALVERPGQSMRDLVARTLTSQSTVSEVVARLIARGLVTRQAAPDDGRRAVLNPTPAGRALVRTAPPTVQADLIEGLHASRLDRAVPWPTHSSSGSASRGSPTCRPPCSSSPGARHNTDRRTPRGAAAGRNATP